MLEGGVGANYSIEMSKKVLFVCWSNRARSVAAEYFFRKMLQERDGRFAQEIRVYSAGLGRMSKESLKIAREHPWYAFRTWLKSSPDKHISSVMLEKGFDISRHKARKLKRGWVEGANLVIAMEEGQKRRLISRYPFAKQRVFTLKEISGVDSSSDIKDPAGSSLEDSKACVDKIEQCLREGMERIIYELKKEERA